ncbi:MAG TPA: HPr family phosphocarrier protein [Candidatus Izemoplasmatales bacterium]|nr:HPr family phosphocarrier protein [Bacillota bacterium]HRY78281.1 HPr family phosphocarrier protein [Candidatus Izemoplasmatales bacterium]
MIQANYQITYPHGLHARPATMLVSAANDYQSKIILEYRDVRVTAKSIMGVLSLGIPAQAMFKLTFEGMDEEAAFKAIDQVIFHINKLPAK